MTDAVALDTRDVSASDQVRKVPAQREVRRADYVPASFMRGSSKLE